MSAMRKIDFNRPFGTVHGMPGGACYEQDGVLFDRHGMEIPPSGDEPAAPADAALSPAPWAPVAEENDDATTPESPRGDAMSEEAIESRVLQLHREGKAAKEIWTELDVHHARVSSILKRAQA